MSTGSVSDMVVGIKNAHVTTRQFGTLPEQPGNGCLKKSNINCVFLIQGMEAGRGKSFEKEAVADRFEVTRRVQSLVTSLRCEERLSRCKGRQACCGLLKELVITTNCFFRFDF